jgi:uncharacterized HAD superfamily protein
MLLKSVLDLYDILDDRKTLILLDLDDMLIKGTTTMGSDIWYNRLCKISNNRNKNIELLKHAYSMVEYEAVEGECTKLVLEQLNKNHTIRIVTSRSPSFTDLTLKHINDANLGITNDNIHYCNGEPKSTTIAHIISTITPHERYLFIDDNHTNITEVKSNCAVTTLDDDYNELLLDIECYRYGYMDNVKESYSHKQFIIDTLKTEFIRDVIVCLCNNTYLKLILIMIRFIIRIVTLRFLKDF